MSFDTMIAQTYTRHTMAKKRYQVGEVAELLEVHRNTLFNWIQSGKLRKLGCDPERDPLSGYYYWTESGLKKLRKKSRR